MSDGFCPFILSLKPGYPDQIPVINHTCFTRIEGNML